MYVCTCEMEELIVAQILQTTKLMMIVPMSPKNLPDVLQFMSG